MSIKTFWRACGGRKQFNAYLCALLLTIVVFFVPEGSFRYYGAYLLAALSITTAAIAFEDVRKSKDSEGA